MSPLESLAFPWRRRVYGGSCKTSPFRMCLSVKIGGNLAQNARCDAPTCLLLSLWLSSGVTVSMGEAAKRVVFESFSKVSTCQNCRKPCKKCLFWRSHMSPLESLACLWLLQQVVNTLHTTHSTLYTPHSTLYTPQSPLPTLHFTHPTPHFTLYTPQSTLPTIHNTVHTLPSTLYTLHSRHATLYTPQSQLPTLHSTLHS